MFIVLFFSLSKAVAKTFAVQNLAIYVAQDCTGEHYSQHFFCLIIFL